MSAWWYNWLPSWPSGWLFNRTSDLLRDETATVAGPGDRQARKQPLHWVPVGWACIDLLTTEMSSFPFGAAKKDEEGAMMPVARDSKYARIADFLTHEPSPLMNADQFWRHMWWQVHATGNAYALITRSPRGVPIGLEPVTRIIPPQLGPSLPLNPLPYRFHEYGVREFPRRDVLAIHGPGYNVRNDYSPSPFYIAAKNLGYLDAAVDELMDSLDDPRNLYSITSDIPEEAADLAGHAINVLRKSRERGEDPVLVNADIHRRQPGTTVRTQGRTEDYRWEAEEACRAWRVPPRAISLLSVGMRTEAPLMGQRADLVMKALRPHATALSSEIQRKLLTPGDRHGGHQVVLDLDAELRGTLNERAQAAELLVARSGVWTINEGRRLTGKPPHDDGDRLIDPKGGPEQGEGANGKGERASPTPSNRP